MQQSWADKGRHAIGHGAGLMATAAGVAKAKATDLSPDALGPSGGDLEAVPRSPIFAEPDDERDRTVADSFRDDGAEHDLRAGSIVVDADALLLANLVAAATTRNSTTRRPGWPPATCLAIRRCRSSPTA